MMLGGEDDVSGSGVLKYLRPRIRIPLLNLAVEDWSEIVIVVVCAVVFAVIILGWGPVETHAVEVPLRVRIVGDVILGREIVLRVDQRRPAWDRVKAPVDKDS